MPGMVRICVFALFVMVADHGQAVVHQLDPVDGYDCAGGMSTSNCFSSPTATGWSGPVTMACEARGSRNQRCRDCVPDHGLDGQPLGHNVCAFVARNAACDCAPAGQPRCTGNTWSSCSYSV